MICRAMNRRKTSLAEALAATRADHALYTRRFLSPLGVLARFLKGSPNTSAPQLKKPVEAETSSKKGRDKPQKRRREASPGLAAEGYGTRSVVKRRERGVLGRGRVQEGGGKGGEGDVRKNAINWYVKTAKRRELLQLEHEGKRVCYRFQRGTCADADCHFVHQCAWCKGPKGFDSCNCDKRDLERRASGL